MADDSRVRFEVEGGVCTLTLVNPSHRNALTETMMAQLEDAYRAIAAAPEIRAVLLCGNERNFCAGADISMLSRLDGITSARACVQAFRRVFQGLEQLDRPTVCAVSGFALGAGLELCLAADMVVAADGARFGVPEVKLGAVPGYAMVRLQDSIGRTRAMEMMYTGRVISAAKAVEWGLVNRVVADDAIDEAGQALAAELALAAPVALATIKRSLARNASEGEWDGFVSGASSVLSTADARRGSRAFLAKETPTFLGS